MPAAFEGEPLEIGFNPEFLKEGIESVEGDEVMLRLISPLRPGPAAAGRQRGLPLPGDADPPQRLRWRGRCSSPRSKRGRCAASSGVAGRAARRGSSASIGPNGAGKTNLLEALYFALTGRSFRTSDRRDLIPFGGSLARAEATVRDEDGIERRLLASVSRTEGRRHLLDGSPADPATLARSRPPVAVFAPDRLALVKGPPAERRAHLDGFVAARWPARGGAAQALRPGAGAAQRAALAARRRATGRRRTSTSGTRASPRPPRRWSRPGPRRSPSWPRPSPTPRPSSGSRAARARVRAARRRARRRRSAPACEERREPDLRLGRSSWGPHLDELKLRGGGPLAAPLRLAGPAARRPARPALRRARGAAGGAPGDPAAAARRRDERARPGPPRAPGRAARRRRPGADHRRRRGVGAGRGARRAVVRMPPPQTDERAAA